MAIKSLLVHLDDRPASTLRLEAGLALAQAFGAHVTALCLIAEPYLRVMPGRHLPADFARIHLDQLKAEAEALLSGARAAAGQRGLELETRCQIGTLDHLPIMLAREARQADLTLIGQAGLESSGADDALLAEAAFMDTGRPALVVPADGAGKLPPRRAIVAWDGSREAARAAGDAVPLLQAAEDVVVLVVDPNRAGARFSDQPGTGLARYLTRHGIEARLKPVRSDGHGIASVILDQVREESADLLVMGGYGHSRFREFVLGGMTRSMLGSMTVPVLMSH
jgi:nucleotide-binding universal stress UspA family protein